jgi:tetratricopeptide (TPR) repeat protein
LKEAIEQCRESLRLKPDYGPARLNLAEYLAAQGEKEEAITEYLRLLDIIGHSPFLSRSI